MIKFNAEKRIVAFIDILGFKEHIKSKEKQEILLNILYEIKKINSSHKSNITQENPGHHSIQIIPDVSSYSDNIIISVPTEPSTPLVPLYFDSALTFIIHSIRELQVSTLSKGIALRGAISYGDVHFDSQNNIFVGSPLIDTIEDERILAKYPRVVISKRLLEFIAKRRKTTLYDMYHEMDHALMEFRIDYDGMYYLDFFKLLVLMPINAERIFSYFNEVKIRIEINIEKCMDNFHIVSKWYWLANYFDFSVDMWEKKNPQFKIDRFNLRKNNYENL